MREPERISVAAGVIRAGGRTLICSRPETSPLADFWEFPGGKCEPGETPEECVVRELREELGIESVALDRLYRICHDYPGKKVRVFFIRCLLKPDSPQPRRLDQQEFQWVSSAQLIQAHFLPADLPFAFFLAAGAEGISMQDGKNMQ